MKYKVLVFAYKVMYDLEVSSLVFDSLYKDL